MEYRLLQGHVNHNDEYYLHIDVQPDLMGYCRSMMEYQWWQMGCQYM